MFVPPALLWGCGDALGLQQRVCCAPAGAGAGMGDVMQLCCPSRAWGGHSDSQTCHSAQEKGGGWGSCLCSAAAPSSQDESAFPKDL